MHPDGEEGRRTVRPATGRQDRGRRAPVAPPAAEPRIVHAPHPRDASRGAIYDREGSRSAAAWLALSVVAACVIGVLLLLILAFGGPAEFEALPGADTRPYDLPEQQAFD